MREYSRKVRRVSALCVESTGETEVERNGRITGDKSAKQAGNMVRTCFGMQGQRTECADMV